LSTANNGWLILIKVNMSLMSCVGICVGFIILYVGYAMMGNFKVVLLVYHSMHLCHVFLYGTPVFYLYFEWEV